MAGPKEGFADHDTIVGVATPPGIGGIAVVRLSGGGAREIARRLFRGRRASARAILSGARRGMAVGVVVDPAHDTVLDQCLLLSMPGPGSYTGEDVIEIQCHGGMLVVNRIVNACLGQGARLANAGEFTLRAYLSGRMDLTQAEAVANLIAAQTDEALRIAAGQIAGSLGNALAAWQAKLRTLAATVEVTMDFPDEEYEVPAYDDVLRELSVVQDGLTQLLGTAVRGRRLGEGLSLVIAGRPNVGKSSIFNRLLGQPRAIVTDIPGTTRDVVEAQLELAGVPVRLQDSAGVRESAGTIEQLGIAMTETALQHADLVLLVLEAGASPSEDDRRALTAAAGAPCIVVVNKIDIPELNVDSSAALRGLGLPEGTPAVEVSALTGAGWPALLAALTHLAHGPGVIAKDAAVITTARQERQVQAALSGLATAAKALNANLPPDVSLIGVYIAIEALAYASGTGGAEARQEVLREVFARFCLGK